MTGRMAAPRSAAGHLLLKVPGEASPCLLRLRCLASSRHNTALEPRQQSRDAA